MVAETIELTVRRYLQAARQSGIHAHRAVLFGSCARGQQNEWSDIDLIVIAPELDGSPSRNIISKLWELRATTDARIEPIHCGEREWETNTSRPILKIARREGVIIEEA